MTSEFDAALEGFIRARLGYVNGLRVEGKAWATGGQSRENWPSPATPRRRPRSPAATPSPCSAPPPRPGPSPHSPHRPPPKAEPAPGTPPGAPPQPNATSAPTRPDPPPKPPTAERTSPFPNTTQPRTQTHDTPLMPISVKLKRLRLLALALLGQEPAGRRDYRDRATARRPIRASRPRSTRAGASRRTRAPAAKASSYCGAARSKSAVSR